MAARGGVVAVNGVRIHAPAKINLGLAILGKRADGYHEIDTIMAMIDLADTITLRAVDTPGVSISGMDKVPVDSNLMSKAVRGWCELTGQRNAYHIEIAKRIPSPAGLGGGSSDAVAVIRALTALHPDALSQDEMLKLAASLGADCPFFLGTTCARATGIGTDLAPQSSPKGWIVVVVPPQDLHDKTSALYGSLMPQDYGSRDDIEAIVAKLPRLEDSTLPNSFTRAALATFPSLAIATSALTSVTGKWTLSGAGPAIFALATSSSEIAEWTDRLSALLPPEFAVLKAQFLAEPPQPELLP